MSKTIGLTGGIASGKTTVSKILELLGAIIIDADLIAREVVKKGTPALKSIEAVFGKEFITKDGELNRKKLGVHVFSNKKALEKLNSITHPIIINHIQNQIIELKKNNSNSIIVLDAALLIEMKLTSLVDEVWVVAVTFEEQLKRLMERDGLSKRQAIDRINSQMNIEEKKAYADKIIDNSGGLSQLEALIINIWKNIKD
ncbi:dephospho-CoA kinase [Alkaliphilus pronyensis]|uniref:Dephospho-CoA kinase n=1 Tax=Alkaliphilus pronyensis TaxID=1482732 RepID=A0A6I0FIU4_9FIRM|nr:dephospho-CoA kinase [Alkaliphilus pronyensis]KAB3539037.1 dephospho-CoA kinase [Alkaliphilus pronyensis]